MTRGNVARAPGSWLLWLLAALAALATPAGRAAEVVAMVTDISGEAVVSVDGAESPVALLASLAPGAEISLAGGARVSLVYFASSREHSYAGPARLVVEAEAPKLIEGKAAEVRELAIAKETGISPVAEGYGQAALVFRGGVKKPLVRQFHPVNSKLLVAPREFVWEGPAEDSQYRFVLQDEQGQVVMETLVNAPRLSLSPEVRLRNEALYTWTVDAHTAAGEKYSASADFSVVADADRQRLERLRPAGGATFSERVVYALLLEQEGLREAAREVWGALVSERPGAPALKERAGQ